jgi:hypothetical protein
VGDYYLSCPTYFQADAGSTVNVGTGTIESSGTVTLSGTFNPGTGTFYYSGANTQTIVNTTYHSLKVKTTSSTTRDLTSSSLSCTNLEIVSDGSSGNAQLNGDLDIDGGITIGEYAYLLSNGYDINLGGDWTNNGGSNLSFSAGTESVTFDGTSNQGIGGATTTYFYSATINNSAGITLNRSIAIDHSLTFTSGIIHCNSSLVWFSNSASSGGASNTSFVDGRVAHSGNSGFNFPVGDVDKYAPVFISGTGPSQYVSVEYHKSTPTNNLSLTYPLTKVSNHEYWRINGASSSNPINVGLYWEDSKWSGIGDFDDLRIARYTGSSWVGETGTYSNSGSVGLTASNSGRISVTDISSSAYYTFGTINNITNPLPIELLSFTAKADDDVVLVDWQTATETNNDYFIIERSKDGITSERIGIVQGAGNSNKVLDYEFVDQNPYSGVSYYRLTQVDYDGQSETFDWVAVNREVENEASVNIYPNPLSSGSLNIQFDNYHGQTEIVIFDLSGRRVYRDMKQIDSASQNFLLALNLPKGMYSVQIISENKIQIKKLIIN